MALVLVFCGCQSECRLPQAKLDLWSIDTAVVNDPNVLRRLDSIIIPHVALTNVHVQDAVAFLHDFAKENERRGGPKGFLVPLNQGPGEPPTEAQQKESERIAALQITVDEKNISLLDMIKRIAREADLQFSVYGDGLLVYEPKTAQQSAGQPTSDSAPSAASDAGQR